MTGSAAAAPCTVAANGTVTVNNANNTAGCEVNSLGPTIAGSTFANVFLVYSQNSSRTLTINSDLTLNLTTGVGGISSYSNGSANFSTFNAAGRTLNLTLNAAPSAQKIGVGVSQNSVVNIGTLNLTMQNLPAGSGFSQLFEHYGVLAGSSVLAGETATTNGMYSRATFDNLNIRMSSAANLLGYPLLVGIRAIQGAYNNSGNGASGYVVVNDDLDINITAASNDALGIYVSGGDSQVHLNNSNITIASTSTRANAIRLGKTAAVGTGVGKLYSTGAMTLNTTAAPNDAAIDIIWQGALLHANADTSSTTINAGGAAISVSGNSDQASAQTITSFNNLVATTTSATADLVEVGTGQADYRLNVRGANSNLTASPTAYIIDVAGGAATPSTVTMNFSEGYMQGLTRKTAASTLNLNLGDGATWQLAPAGAGTTASFTALNLTNSYLIGHNTGPTAANYTLQGNVTNTGSEIDLLNGVAGDMLTINGNYIGNGGLLLLDTVLGDDASTTDRLIVNGNTSGTSSVKVTNVGGIGAQTIEGIKIIDVAGASDGAFTLVGDYTFQGDQAVIAGAYAYRLYKNGVSTTTDGDWYLRSTTIPTDPTDPTDPVDPIDPVDPLGPLYQAGVPVYEAYSQALLGLNGLPTLQQRVGNRFWSSNGAGIVSEGADAVQEQAPVPEDAAALAEGRGVWGRIEASHASIDPAVATTVAEYDYDIYKLQAGLDVSLHEGDAGTLIGGLTGHYGHAAADVSSFYGNGDIATDGYGFGGTLTWYGTNGFYLDGQGQVSWYDSDLTSHTELGRLADGNDGFGYALSLESGQRIDLNDGWTITPQAQLVYSSVDFDAFTQMSGDVPRARVSLLDGDSLRGRLGLTLDREASWQADDGTLSRSHVYGIGNLYYEFLDGTAVDVSGVSFRTRGDRLWGGVGLGGSYNWSDDRYSIYGEGSVNTSLADFGDSYEVKGTAGFRVKW